MSKILTIGQNLVWEDAPLGEVLATVHTNGADARYIAKAVNTYADIQGLKSIIADLHGALRRIADCNESDLARYVAKVDSIAVDALVSGEIDMEDVGIPVTRLAKKEG